MALTIRTAIRITNKTAIAAPKDYTRKDADLIMAIVDSIINGQERIKPCKVYATYAEMKAVTGEEFEHAGCTATSTEYRWDVASGDWMPLP